MYGENTTPALTHALNIVRCKYANTSKNGQPWMYSCYIIYLQCTNNNLASTVFQALEGAVQVHGLPSHVRGDREGKNVDIADYMITQRGVGRAVFCVITTFIINAQNTCGEMCSVASFLPVRNENDKALKPILCTCLTIYHLLAPLNKTDQSEIEDNEKDINANIETCQHSSQAY